MSDAVIVAIIALLGTVFSAVWQNRRIKDGFEEQAKLSDARLEKESQMADARLEKQFALADARQEQAQAIVNQKIDELSKRVEKHNNVIERVYKLEQDSAVQQEMLVTIHHRLDDIQQKIGA